MELYTLKINVTNQRLSFGENPPEIYSGDQSIDFVEFTFTDDTWNFPNIWAIFYRQKGAAYQIALDDNKVMIPAEVMQKRGYVYIGLMATDGENVQTSSVLQYSIRQGAANVDTITPSPSIYEQFINDLEAYQEAIQNLSNLSAVAETLAPGSSATASYLNGVLTLGIPQGATGATGATGNGIQSIEKTGTSGNVDTYTITYTNGQTTMFTVTNGSVTSVDGQTGDVTLDDKANIDGYYEDLTAGYAENLISNVYDEESVPYNFRPAGGSLDIGTFEYDEIVGGSLPINQLVRNGNFADSSAWGSIGTNAIANNEVTLTSTGTNPQLYQDGISIQTNHKYIIFATFTTPSATSKTRIDLYNPNGSQNLLPQTAFSQGTQNLQVVFKADYTLSMRVQFFPDYNSSTTGTVYKYKNINLIDLTQMFGTTIADYIYTLETGQAGAGVAWFMKLFPKSYYPYNTGSLEHVQTSGHKMVGFNQWDEDWEEGGIKTADGTTVASQSVRSKNFNGCFPSTTYYIRTAGGASSNVYIFFYDADKNYISYETRNNATVTTPSTAHYFKIQISSAYGTVYHNDICINLHWDGERDGEYEAYKEYYYPLDSTLVLRGKPYLDSANRLKYDGDIYNPNGTVTRKYEERAYQSGDESLADAITDGTTTVYKLTTPTTETADTFQTPQSVDNWGTEEYIDTRSIPIPVGHNTKYPPNLTAKLESSANPPDSDGDYLLRHVNGTNAYVALSTNATIQNIIARLEALEG